MKLSISEVRKKKGMTQQNLSDITGINQRIISRFELGYSLPRIDQLAAIIKALGAEWDEVVEL